QGYGRRSRQELALCLRSARLLQLEPHDDRGDHGRSAAGPGGRRERSTPAVTMRDLTLAGRISENDQLRGMGATMTGALIEGDKAVISHVGDCRTYLIRDGQIEQLTQDHSWVAEQVRNGSLDRLEAKRHPMRNVVTRAVAGLEENFQLDVRELPVQAGDQPLFCFD